MSDEAVRRDVLGIADDKQEEAVEAVLRLFADRLCAAKRQQLEWVVREPIHPTRVTSFRKALLEALRNHRQFSQGVIRLGVAPLASATCYPYPRVTYRCNIWKECLLQGANDFANIDNIFAEELGQQEAIRLAWAIEQNAHTVGRIDALTALPDAVRSAAAAMRAGGREPNALFVPRQGRFEYAIGGQEAWRWPEHGTLGIYHLGKWEGLQTFAFPHIDAASVVLVDSRRSLCGGALDEGSTLHLNVLPPDQEHHQAMLESAKGERDPGKIASTTDVNVLGAATLTCDVGLAEVAAASRIECDLEQFGFVLQAGETVYHKPGCQRIVPDKQQHYSMGAWLKGDTEDRTPCDVCKPDDWAEGEET